MSDAPLHVQVIEMLERRLAKRREEHRAKAGDGLADQEYQRMVGRIRESTAILKDLEELKKQSLGQLEEEEENSDEPTANRHQSRSRRT